MNSVQGYNTAINAQRTKLGSAYEEFSKFVTALMENIPDDVGIRRRTPKHEWTLPYLVRYITPEETQEYLLVLGAEVKAKPRGMGYSTREQYAFTPYFVFATAQEGELDYGEPIGERHVGKKTFREHTSQNGNVVKTVVELLQHVRAKEGR